MVETNLRTPEGLDRTLVRDPTEKLDGVGVPDGDGLSLRGHPPPPGNP